MPHDRVLTKQQHQTCPRLLFLEFRLACRHCNRLCASGFSNTGIISASGGGLCGLSSHNLSEMRELLGMPRRVIAARQCGSFLTALFEYESFTVTFETGIDHNRRFDAHIQVYGETKEIRVQYDTPYIRHLPTQLFLTETQGEVLEERVIRPTFTDPYTLELLHFYEVVTHNVQPKTSAEDFLYDLDLFDMIMHALRQ